VENIARTQTRSIGFDCFRFPDHPLKPAVGSHVLIG